MESIVAGVHGIHRKLLRLSLGGITRYSRTCRPTINSSGRRRALWRHIGSKSCLLRQNADTSGPRAAGAAVPGANNLETTNLKLPPLVPAPREILATSRIGGVGRNISAYRYQYQMYLPSSFSTLAGGTPLFVLAWHVTLSDPESSDSKLMVSNAQGLTRMYSLPSKPASTMACPSTLSVLV